MGSAVLLVSLCFLTSVVTSARLLKLGEIVYRQYQLADGDIRFDVTDGNVFIQSVVTLQNGMQNCVVTRDFDSIVDILLAKDTKHKHIGEFEVNEMIENCNNFNTRKRSLLDNLTNEPFAPEKTGKPDGPSGSFAIFPGTKWCGYENVAKNYSDLGEHKATDTCCRTHDHCPYFIDRWQTKYNYFNPYPWTLSNCDCDNGLYDCLKSVNTTAANEVGQLFFGVLNVKCFSFEKGSYCAQRHWSHLWCEKKAKGYEAVPEDFPHKWGDKYNVTASLVG